MHDATAAALLAPRPSRDRRAGIALVACLGSLLVSACSSDPPADGEPVFAEVFWMRADEKVGVIDHSLVSASLPEESYRRQAPAAVETRKASRKTIPDWRMADLLAELENLDFEVYAGDRIDPAALDAVGIVRDGQVRVVSITPLIANPAGMSQQQINAIIERMPESEKARRKRAREIFYLVTQVDNATMGFQTETELRPDDFQQQQEQIRRAAEEAARRKRAGGGP